MLDSFLAAVLRFTEEVIGLPIPRTPTPLSDARASFRINHIKEELDEYIAAKADGDVAEQADAFVDVIYLALGALVEMGITPGPVFNEVQRANMDKVQGEVSKRPGSGGFDAIKPEGWQGPNIAQAMLSMTPDVIESMSPVHLEIAQLRAKKGADYNSCVKLTDYFPLGHQSYVQMMHLKAKRALSLVDIASKGGEANFEGLRDTLLDSLNYTTFWVEAIDRGEV